MLRLVSPITGLLLALASTSATAAETLKPLRILVTNDDGISSEGISALVQALKPFADIVVSAPARNFSGASQSVTLFNGEVRVREAERVPGVPGYAVEGTPADATIFGLQEVGKTRPFDMVISGINKGENVGEAVYVSGTVGAARQAAMLGIPAIAVSQAHVRDGRYDFQVAAQYTARLAQVLSKLGPQAPKLVSVNVPAKPKGVKMVPAGGTPFAITGFKRIGAAPDGAALYAPNLTIVTNAPDGSDTQALAEGYIAVTVLSLDPNVKEASLPTAALELEAAEQ